MPSTEIGEQSTWLCCFCGDVIVISAVDPCSLVVTTRENNDQVWFCHSECFRKRLCDTPDGRVLFRPMFFAPGPD